MPQIFYFNTFILHQKAEPQASNILLLIKCKFRTSTESSKFQF